MEKCKTLGEETYFEFSYEEKTLKIKYGFTGFEQTKVEVSNSLIVEVVKRVNFLIERFPEHSREVGYYSKTYWEECPQTIYCPYIAKLVLDVFPKEIIMEIVNL